MRHGRGRRRSTAPPVIFSSAQAERIELEPFRETGWQRLIRALADGGNRAEALRAYTQCKKLLADELGIAPSPETEAIVRGLRARG